MSQQQEAHPTQPPAPSVQVKEHPAPRRADHLPPFRVLLHNDDVNDMVYVVETLVEITPLDLNRATDVMLEAHNRGIAQVLVTHRERAELYVDQFSSKRLRASMEPAE